MLLSNVWVVPIFVLPGICYQISPSRMPSECFQTTVDGLFRTVSTCGLLRTRILPRGSFCNLRSCPTFSNFNNSCSEVSCIDSSLSISDALNLSSADLNFVRSVTITDLSKIPPCVFNTPGLPSIIDLTPTDLEFTAYAVSSFDRKVDLISTLQ